MSIANICHKAEFSFFWKHIFGSIADICYLVYLELFWQIQISIYWRICFSGGLGGELLCPLLANISLWGLRFHLVYIYWVGLENISLWGLRATVNKSHLEPWKCCPTMRMALQKLHCTAQHILVFIRSIICLENGRDLVFLIFRLLQRNRLSFPNSSKIQSNQKDWKTNQQFFLGTDGASFPP